MTTGLSSERKANVSLKLIVSVPHRCTRGERERSWVHVSAPGASAGGDTATAAAATAAAADGDDDRNKWSIILRFYHTAQKLSEVFYLFFSLAVCWVGSG